MNRTLIHPGKILADELEELEISASKLARIIEVPASHHADSDRQALDFSRYCIAPESLFRHNAEFLA